MAGAAATLAPASMWMNMGIYSWAEHQPPTAQPKLPLLVPISPISPTPAGSSQDSWLGSQPLVSVNGAHFIAVSTTTRCWEFASMDLRGTRFLLSSPASRQAIMQFLHREFRAELLTVALIFLLPASIRRMEPGNGAGILVAADWMMEMQ